MRRWSYERILPWQIGQPVMVLRRSVRVDTLLIKLKRCEALLVLGVAQPGRIAVSQTLLYLLQQHALAIHLLPTR